MYAIVGAHFAYPACASSVARRMAPVCDQIPQRPAGQQEEMRVNFLERGDSWVRWVELCTYGGAGGQPCRRRGDYPI